MTLETIYSNLTSVDIEKQRQIWDERGKGYYGEYLLLTELYQHVKGQCKILMNLNIPAANGKTTEIDLLMIHESGLYVFEAKYYKGTIYGRYADAKWTQYFRTQENSHFPSPIKQNAYHAEALKKMFPAIPVNSFVVFTNNDTDIKVTGWETTGVVVCKLNEIGRYIEKINGQQGTCISPEKIDEMFKALSVYAPMRKETLVEEQAQVIPLTEYVEKMKADFAAGLSENRRAEKKRFSAKIGGIIGAALIVCALVVIAASYVVTGEKKKTSEAELAQKNAEAVQESAEKAMVEFAKKFKQVEPMNGGDVQLEDGFLEVTDLSLEKSEDLKDTYLFSCKLKVSGKKYGIHLTRATSIIVQMKDGTVAEYQFEKIAGIYTERWVMDGLSQELPEIQIYTDSSDNIEYIKLSKATVCGHNEIFKDYLPGIEFELYSAK